MGMIIYKIENPVGSVYIGQTINFYCRIAHYKGLHCKGQEAIYRSLLKYGFDSHEIKILHELPSDAGQEVLGRYEELYISFYKDAGFKMLNIREGGLRARTADATKKKVV